jgi:hypothetical protein
MIRDGLPSKPDLAESHIPVASDSRGETNRKHRSEARLKSIQQTVELRDRLAAIFHAIRSHNDQGELRRIGRGVGDLVPRCAGQS